MKRKLFAVCTVLALAASGYAAFACLSTRGVRVYLMGTRMGSILAGTWQPALLLAVVLWVPAVVAAIRKLRGRRKAPGKEQLPTEPLKEKKKTDRLEPRRGTEEPELLEPRKGREETETMEPAGGTEEETALLEPRGAAGEETELLEPRGAAREETESLASPVAAEREEPARPERDGGEESVKPPVLIRKEQRVCPNCGHHVSGKRFCAKCGTKVGE